jgi:hypothetical protein
MYNNGSKGGINLSKFTLCTIMAAKVGSILQSSHYVQKWQQRRDQSYKVLIMYNNGSKGGINLTKFTLHLLAPLTNAALNK